MTKYVHDTYENDFNLEFTYHMYHLYLNLTLIGKNENTLHLMWSWKLNFGEVRLYRRRRRLFSYIYAFWNTINI